MDKIVISLEDLVYYWIEEKEGRHRSEVYEIGKVGDEVRIHLMDREVALDALKHVDLYMHGAKARYIKNLIESDIAENYPEENKEEEKYGGPDEPAIEGHNLDSPTYGDLQSPAAEKIRGRAKRNSS